MHLELLVLQDMQSKAKNGLDSTDEATASTRRASLCFVVRDHSEPGEHGGAASMFGVQFLHQELGCMNLLRARIANPGMCVTDHAKECNCGSCSVIARDRSGLDHVLWHSC